MSIDHEYKCVPNSANKTQTPAESKVPNRIAVGPMPTDRRIYCVQKPIQGGVPFDPRANSARVLPAANASRVPNQPPLVRPSQYVVVTSSSNVSRNPPRPQYNQVYRRPMNQQQNGVTYIAPRTVSVSPQQQNSPIYTPQQIRQAQYVQAVAPQRAQPQNNYPHEYTNGGASMMNLAVPMREPTPEAPPPQMIEVKQECSTQSTSEEPMPDDSEIDIQIRNVVCNYTLPLHIDLRKLAMNTSNVTYEREKGVMMKQKRAPNCYIKVYSSGKVYIVGCRSESDCKKAARSIARHIQKVMEKTSERVSIRNYRVNNVLATCRMPFGIKIEEVAAKYPAESTYEPELSVGLVWKSTQPKATLRIHTTGSITVTGASSENDVLSVISNIYPIVLQFRCLDRAKDVVAAKKRKRKMPAYRQPIKRERMEPIAYGHSGVYNNKVCFSDEEEDLYGELDLDD